MAFIVSTEPQGALQVSLSTEESPGEISRTVQVVLLDSFGFEIQPENDIEICFQVSSDTKKDETCLGFFNTENQQWECEDECLSEPNKNTLCGQTDHLTNFGLLLTGSGGADKCDSAGGIDQIILYLSIAFAACAIMAIIFIALSSYTPPMRAIILGAEANRIAKLRNSSSPTVDMQSAQ